MKFVVMGCVAPAARIASRCSVKHAQQLVGGVAAEVERLRRVDQIRHAARRQDLVEVAVALRPDERAPRVVERVDRAVARAQPAAELARRLVAEVDLAVLVADVPHAHGGVVRRSARRGRVAIDERVLAVDRATRA